MKPEQPTAVKQVQKAVVQARGPAKKTSYGPWIAGALLAISVYYFWLGPMLNGSPKVNVQFEQGK